MSEFQTVNVICGLCEKQHDNIEIREVAIDHVILYCPVQDKEYTMDSFFHNGDTCIRCTFHDIYQGKITCHAHAPAANAFSDETFPKVEINDWCGEFYREGDDVIVSLDASKRIK